MARHVLRSTRSVRERHVSNKSRLLDHSLHLVLSFLLSITRGSLLLVLSFPLKVSYSASQAPRPRPYTASSTGTKMLPSCSTCSSPLFPPQHHSCPLFPSQDILYLTTTSSPANHLRVLLNSCPLSPSRHYLYNSSSLGVYSLVFLWMSPFSFFSIPFTLIILSFFFFPPLVSVLERQLRPHLSASSFSIPL